MPMGLIFIGVEVQQNTDEDTPLRMNSETHPYTQRHINSLIYLCYTINNNLSGDGELTYDRGASSLLKRASCLLNGASCLLNVGRNVLGRVFFEASCLGACCLWGELSVIRFGRGSWADSA